MGRQLIMNYFLTRFLSENTSRLTKIICFSTLGLLWKVYQGYKKSTKQDASIFVFEKKLLERWPRESRDTILESLKRGVSQLTKLRHPQILIVQHPLEESRESLAFATEPVFASLANVLGYRENMPTTNNKEFVLYDIEIKYGMLQVLYTLLAFLVLQFLINYFKTCFKCLRLKKTELKYFLLD